MKLAILLNSAIVWSGNIGKDESVAVKQAIGEVEQSADFEADVETNVETPDETEMKTKTKTV